MVASTSCVRVVHIDCTATGAPSPIAVPPTQTRLDLRRERGAARSSGRFRSTLIGVSISSSVGAGAAGSCSSHEFDFDAWQPQKVTISRVNRNPMNQGGRCDEYVEWSWA